MPDSYIASIYKGFVWRFVYICHVRTVHIEIHWASEYETATVDNRLPFEILPEKGEDSYPYIQVWPADTPYSAG